MVGTRCPSIHVTFQICTETTQFTFQNAGGTWNINWFLLKWMTDKTLLSHGFRLWSIQPQVSTVDDQYLRMGPIDCLYASKRSPPYGPLLLDMLMFMPDMLGAAFCALLYIELGPPMPGPPRPTTPIGPPLPLTHLQQKKPNFSPSADISQSAWHSKTSYGKTAPNKNVCDWLEPMELLSPT